jgi:ATP-dependent phosphoenolpyruvate carboxykinase
VILLDLIMRDCIILDNIIIDYERDDDYDDNYRTVTSVVATPITYKASASLTTILQWETHLTSELMLSNIQSDLIEHVYYKFH